MEVPEALRTALADRYRIERELGQGGMATVYLAEDLKHHRKVAVKVLRPELAATLGPERFPREIEIAARLQHPHILPPARLRRGRRLPLLRDAVRRGRVAARPARPRQGELPVPEAVRLLTEIADALATPTGGGVVHRDIKPENVMLSGRHALVMDFGVAKAVSEATRAHQLTTAGVALGTPAYMAPEQASADPHLDHRVDIYAVGVMAYEMLAGAAPVPGARPAADPRRPRDPGARAGRPAPARGSRRRSTPPSCAASPSGRPTGSRPPTSWWRARAAGHAERRDDPDAHPAGRPRSRRRRSWRSGAACRAGPGPPVPRRSRLPPSLYGSPGPAPPPARSTRTSWPCCRSAPRAPTRASNICGRGWWT